MISVELPWGADKAIQVFGRVHRANQLVPPRFITLCTNLGGEVRFISAIARRMKLLGAVTKCDRMTSMGGVADRHMSEFDVNNGYGEKALEFLYRDSTRVEGPPSDLQDIYETLPFIGEAGVGEATGRWPTPKAFLREVGMFWRTTNMIKTMDALVDRRTTEGIKVDSSGMREITEMNRFFNRLLMMEVEVQNSIFDAFFAIYTELVRIDRANGTYDEGVENLNHFRGRKVSRVEVSVREVLCTDAVSGAETQYTRLKLDRGISWEAAVTEYDTIRTGHSAVEGFYAFRLNPSDEPVYILVKELAQLGGAGNTGATWLAKRRRKQFIIWRADLGSTTGSDLGQLQYSAEDFANDERFEHLADTPEDLQRAEAGWRKLYDLSANTRIAYEHVLTGDVLSAWRLVGSEDGAKEPLRIVRATVQPDGMPVVGVRISESDLPKLRYILGCQHVASKVDQTESTTEANDIDVRMMTLRAAEATLKMLKEASDGLPDGSWMAIHKLLAEDGCLPQTPSAIRGVQRALDLLFKRKLADGTESGGLRLVKATDGDEELPTGMNLEKQLFPEEFADAPKSDDEDNSNEDSEEDDDGLSDISGLSDLSLDPSDEPEDDMEDARPAASGNGRGAGKSSRTPSAPATGSKSRVQKAAETSTSKSLASISKSDNQETFPGKRVRGQGDEATMESQAKKPRRQQAEVAANSTKNKGKLETAKDPVVAESDKKRQRQEMAKALFGDSSTGDSSSSDSSSDEASGDPAAATAAKASSSSSAKIWNYEVTGKQLRIRQSADVNSEDKNLGYLAPGERFVVDERQLGKDGRTYLRLADGRGWAYDRSAKDITKVVVREL
eukprot:TRINITY_DN23992_c0_g2_i1.p1 TRINITY_DN23992_c0_g2~~TRINITY_DN23992_c0_g2_i1.p1  ORF type:complete len:841 (+),score=179.26 TRINITY_DN23992_c0_g2_i1:2-2524(+)